MKRSCSLYANKRLFYSLLSLFFFFSFTGFFEQWSPTHLCFFSFSSWIVLSLQISQFGGYSEVHPCFINFIPYPVADPSPPFTSVLMMLIFKEVFLHISTTFSFSHTNTFSVTLPSSPCSLLQVFSPICSDQPSHYDTSERSKFFPP